VPAGLVFYSIPFYSFLFCSILFSSVLLYSSFHVNSEYYFAAAPSLSFVPSVRHSGQTNVQKMARTLIY
jgi:hypothetical protein